MSEPLETNGEIDLQEWLKEKGKELARRDQISGNSSLSPVQPIGCPVPGHVDHLLVGMPPAGLTAEEERSSQSGQKWEKWEPKRLNSRHREIMRRILEGATSTLIAEQMGMSKVAVSLVITSKLFRDELEKLESQRDEGVIHRAESLSGEALDTLKTQMRFARSEAIKNRAANDILDRAGYTKIERKLIGVVNAEEVIRELNRQRRDSLNQKLAGEGKGETV